MSAVLIDVTKAPIDGSTLVRRTEALRAEVARIRAEEAKAAQEDERLTAQKQRELQRAASLRAQITAAESARDAAAAHLQRVRMDGGDESKPLAALEAAEHRLAQARLLESQAAAAEREAAEVERQRVQIPKVAGDSPARMAALRGDMLEAQADALGDKWVAVMQCLDALTIEAMALDELLTKAGRIGGLALRISTPWGFAVPPIQRGAGQHMGPGAGLSGLKLGLPQTQARVRTETQRIDEQLRAEGL
jgi:hypothetical protein